MTEQRNCGLWLVREGRLSWTARLAKLVRAERKSNGNSNNHWSTENHLRMHKTLKLVANVLQQQTTTSGFTPVNQVQDSEATKAQQLDNWKLGGGLVSVTADFLSVWSSLVILRWPLSSTKHFHPENCHLLDWSSWHVFAWFCDFMHCTAVTYLGDHFWPQHCCLLDIFGR